MSDTETRLTALEQRVAFVDILALEGEYCRTWDFGTGEEWAGLFTPDAVFIRTAAPGVAPVPGSPDWQIAGRDALIQAHESLARWFILHQIHLPSIRVQHEAAQALVYFECPVRASAPHGQGLMSREIGVYEVDYVKTPEGWKIAHRVEHPVFRDGTNFFGSPNFQRLETPAAGVSG